MSLHTIAIDNSKGVGVPVVFLHGFGGIGGQWAGLQVSISFYAPTFSFDLPGHGESISYPDFGPPKVAAKAVLAALDELGLQKVLIVGHSMGGAIASLIALMSPERVAGLVLLAPGGFGTEFDHPLLLDWAKAKTEDELKSVMPKFFGDTYKISEKVIEFQKSIRKTEGATKALYEIASGMSSDGKQGMLPLGDLLQTPVPITIVWGDQDQVIPVAQAIALESKAPKGRVAFHILEGVGHSPAEEATQTVKSVIIDQIKALKALS